MSDDQPGAALFDLWNQGAKLLARQAEAFMSLGATPAPQRVQDLWLGAMQEYKGDLGGLPPSAWQVDLAPVTEAWAKTATGTADETQRGMVRRFTEAMSVKARLGPEYYADPEQTPVRPTPRQRVHGEGGVELFRYDPGEGAPPRRGDPVLIVYSVINRSYILDLVEGLSFVRHLLDEGLDVFMVEWGEPEAHDAQVSLDDYQAALAGCVDAARRIAGAERISLFGHCIGGTLAAMHAAQHPDGVARLLALTTPFRAPDSGLVASITEPGTLPIGAVVAGFGKMPAKVIRYTFMALKPYHELLKWKLFVQSLASPDAMRTFAAIDRWANDNVDIPAGVFARYIDEVFQSGRLARGETVIGGEPVDLGAIACPVLNVVGASDWIVPVDCARPLDEQAADATLLEMPGSHLSLILDPRLRGRWSELSDFLLAGAPA
jgi:polyhydroxyalkanoate synthase subunit PhaC